MSPNTKLLVLIAIASVTNQLYSAQVAPAPRMSPFKPITATVSAELNPETPNEEIARITTDYKLATMELFRLQYELRFQQSKCCPSRVKITWLNNAIRQLQAKQAEMTKRLALLQAEVNRTLAAPTAIRSVTPGLDRTVPPPGTIVIYRPNTGLYDDGALSETVTIVGPPARGLVSVRNYTGIKFNVHPDHLFRLAEPEIKS